MRVSIFEVSLVRKLSLLVFILCVLISFKNQNEGTKRGLNNIKPTSTSSSPSPSGSSSPILSASQSTFLSTGDENLGQRGQSYRGLEYDFYRDSCPDAEATIRAVVRYLHKVRSDVGPALLRLAFHDCFVEGCDASILLDAAEGIDSEKDSPPNQNLKGFDIIDIIKEELEEICPGVVSCADILVLAAREGVVLGGGPFYPLYTGRRDSLIAFSDIATFELPSPQGDLSDTLASFASRGFDPRESVSLLGSHSIGVMHCKFFQNRLYNFGGTNKPDPSLDPDFLNLLRSHCKNASSTSSAPSTSFFGSPSSSAAPSPHLDSSPLSSAVPSPELDGSPLSSSAPSPHLDGYSSSPQAQSPHLEGSSSSPQTRYPNFHGSPSSPKAQGPNFNGSPLPSAAPLPHLEGSQFSSAPSLFSLEESSTFSTEEPGIDVAHGGTAAGFGALYYRNLLQGKGILYSDQQLMAGEETRIWVTAYASDVSLFRKDFALAMMKLSNLRILTVPMGQIRLNCSKLA